MKQKVITGYSKEEIESKIDNFLRTDQDYAPINLIMTVKGASKYEYRGFQVREWWSDGQVRYDTGVETQ